MLTSSPQLYICVFSEENNYLNLPEQRWLVLFRLKISEHIYLAYSSAYEDEDFFFFELEKSNNVKYRQ